MSRLGLMRTSKEPLRGTEDGAESGSAAETLLGDAQQQQIHHHHHHSRKDKDRGKSKSREKDAEKASREKDKAKANKTGVPERERVVM